MLWRWQLRRQRELGGRIATLNSTHAATAAFIRTRIRTKAKKASGRRVGIVRQSTC